VCHFVQIFIPYTLSITQIPQGVNMNQQETLNKYTPATIKSGASYACLYATEIALAPDGSIPETPEQGTRLEPVTGFAIISKRDPANELLTVVDVNLGIEVVVGYDDVWNIDQVEYKVPVDEEE